MELPLPEQITAEQWDQISSILIWLWAIPGFMILTAGCMLFGHIIIPSLVDSRDISPKFSSARPFLYGIAAIGAIGVIFCFVSFVGNLGFIYDIYPDKLI